jgi:hypothetical protein
MSLTRRRYCGGSYTPVGHCTPTDVPWIVARKTEMPTLESVVKSDPEVLGELQCSLELEPP